MGINVDAIIHIIAYGVPALLIVFGGILLLLGYPTDNSSMIGGGWVLIVIGVLVYIIEIYLNYMSSQKP